jgi:hypothetical protein
MSYKSSDIFGAALRRHFIILPLSDSPSMSTSSVDFTLFPKLPVEIREEIWRYCLPHRVCELDMPYDRVVFYDRNNRDGPWPCELQYTTHFNGRPPLISRVCRESRSVSFKAGGILPDASSDLPLEARWTSWLSVSTPWQDCARDSAHINWVPACEADWASSGNPFYYLSWHASRVSGGGSLMIKSLEKSFSPYVPFGPSPQRTEPPFTTPLHTEKSRDLDTLQKLSSWLVVMRVIVVHSDRKTAAMTDLFGLFGDAQVRIVDVSQEAKVAAYFDLAETCERRNPVTIRQNFGRDSADSMKKYLRQVIIDQFHSEELATTMHPAIMFRLCTRMCNHIGHRLGWPNVSHDGNERGGGGSGCREGTDLQAHRGSN